MGTNKFEPGAGSYGIGVRAQVFEVIVRQALAGVPWKEICAGPMQVNNISVEEVDQEVRRRKALSSDAPFDPNRPEVPNTMPRGIRNSSASSSSSKYDPYSKDYVPKNGRFGRKVRAQVFDAIVKQALAGVPWREIYIGPMQINDITPEDIEEELRRFSGEEGGSAGAPVPKKPKLPQKPGEIVLQLPPPEDREA